MEEPKTSVKPRVSKAATLTESGLMIAIMAICSWISIPLPGTGVPINLATFAVILTGLLLGSRRGAAATGVFVLLGAVGIPVFAGFTGGMGILAGPTGGYLVGYVFLAMAAGLASPAGQKRSVVRYLVCAAAGEILLYVLGTMWFIHLTSMGIGPALTACVIPFIPGDIAKMILAWIVARRLVKVMGH